MKITNHTILITGGSSGIGLELSKKLITAGNTVIICGRSNEALLAAQEQLPELHVYSCDLSDKNQIVEMADWIINEHPSLNILINNAAIVHMGDFLEMDDAMMKANKEISTNFLAPLHLIRCLFPLIRQNQQARIINVTTGLIYTPRADYSFYNATKAALHSFTQVLRKQIEKSNVKVIEVMFPAVDTPWHKGHPPKIAISAEQAVSGMLAGLEKEKSEIRVGATKMLYMISRIAPKFAFKKVNQIANKP